VNGAGVAPSQIVWLLPMEPGAKLMTVTFTGSVYSVHVLKPIVEETALLNQVSWSRAGESYVSLTAPISVKLIPSVLLCHI